MSEQIAIEQGRMPWAPAGDAELARTLHTYDMPLIGVIRQGGSLHLFRCIEGQVDDNNLWAYTAVDEGDLAALDAAGPDDLDDVIDRVVEGRPVVVALSRPLSQKPCGCGTGTTWPPRSDGGVSQLS